MLKVEILYRLKKRFFFFFNFIERKLNLRQDEKLFLSWNLKKKKI